MSTRRKPRRARAEDRDTLAYNAGRRAHKAGLPLGSNPHERGSVANREWTAGWRASARGRDKDQGDPGWGNHFD